MSYLVIEGTTTEGKKFRPSDWVERLATDFAEFGKDHRLHYSSLVRPASSAKTGQLCLVLDKDSEEKRPDIFNFVMDFARKNKLQVHDQ